LKPRPRSRGFYFVNVVMPGHNESNLIKALVC
jgi:hypothetical protein